MNENVTIVDIMGNIKTGHEERIFVPDLVLLNINFSVLFYDGLSLLAAHVYKPVKFIRA
jgi:hypothetical protein